MKKNCKYILFRADSSSAIGSGHIERCLALANQMKKLGIESYFVCTKTSGNLINTIRTNGFPVFALNNNISESQINDAFHTINIIRHINSRPSLLVADNYNLNTLWERMLRPFTNYIMIIDDLANRSHDCDLLLDSNLYPDLETRYFGKVPPQCLQLLGPKYLLFRPEFESARNVIVNRNQVRRVIIFYGGSDPHRLTLTTLKILLEMSIAHIDVVTGAGNPQIPELSRIIKDIQHAKLHVQIENIAHLMAKSDLAIGACGFSVYERCILGLPSLVVSNSDNEYEFGNNMHDHGYLFHLGKAQLINQADLERAIRTLISDNDRRLSMSSMGLAMADTQGLNRVSNYMLSLIAEK